MRDALPLPLTVEEIDAPWLTAALSRSFPGITVNSFDVLSVRHGFTTVMRVRLHAEGARIPDTLIIKGGFEPWSRDRARTYAIEAIAYRDVWPVLSLNVPKCFFADVESERKQAVMIMEDLTLRDVTFLNPLQTRSYEQVERTLSALAQLHASTWNSPDIQPGGRWEPSRFEPEGRWSGIAHSGAVMFRDYLYRLGYFRPEVFERLARLPRGCASAKQFHDPEWARLGFDYIASLEDVLPSCVVHGDMHLGNLYEEPDGTPGFYDSLPHKDQAHREVAYHITCALDPADRRRWDRALVAHYLSELRRHGVADAPDLDEMMYYFAAFLVYGFYVFFVNDLRWQTESFNTAHAARFSAAMVDHGTKELVIAASHEPDVAKRLESQPKQDVGEVGAGLEWLMDEGLLADPHDE